MRMTTTKAATVSSSRKGWHHCHPKSPRRFRLHFPRRRWYHRPWRPPLSLYDIMWTFGQSTCPLKLSGGFDGWPFISASHDPMINCKGL
jgi:hypothetical protein